ncbi:MAG: GTPase [Bacillota bacterium]|nr:GTPase [Bacillota bacterium]
MKHAEDIFGQFFDRIMEEEKNMQTANLMVVGKTGVGKSTLINSVFREDIADTGIGTPVTQHLRRITKSGVPLTIYDTKGLELDKEIQQAIEKEILSEIDRLNRLNDKDNFIHMIWYCINSASRRIEEFEIEWIRTFSEKIPVIVVLTQSFGKDYKTLEKFIQDLNLPVKGVRSVLARDLEISDEFVLPAFGLMELVDMTFDCLPDAVHAAFINAQKVNIERKLESANRAILPFVTAAFAEGFNPLLFADAALLVPTQLGMLARLTVLFGIPINKSFLTALLSGVLGTGGATAIGRTIVANIFKFVPGVGTLAGGAISGTTAAIITAALGLSYNQVMVTAARKIYAGKVVTEKEMIELMKQSFGDQLKKGKNILKDD